MEYPTLFTAGTRWLAPGRVTTPEGVTVHEAGHQFWYGIVANNEFEDAWMDEGFNTFSTARAIAQVYDPNYLALRYFGGFIPWVFRDIALDRETEGNRLAGYRRDAKSDVPSTPQLSLLSGHRRQHHLQQDRVVAEHDGAVARVAGAAEDPVDAFRRWKFKHPKPNDFFDVATEVLGRDLGWFFDQVYRSSNVFDYGVQELKSTRDQDQYRTSVIVRRYGEATFPIDVLVTFKDGERVTEHWDGKDRWKLYRL